MATRAKPAPKPATPKPAARPVAVPPKPAARMAPANGAGKARPAGKVAFPKKAHAPTHTEFAARLPAAVGKRFEALRAFLDKQGVSEDLYYYGPRTGWAYRYLQDDKSLCSIVIQGGRLVGIVALDAAAQKNVSWDALSDVARRARRVAHGTPALLWLDVPLETTGAADFRQLLKAKLARV